MPVELALLAFHAGGNPVSNTLIHVWPYKILYDEFNCLLLAYY